MEVEDFGYYMSKEQHVATDKPAIIMRHKRPKKCFGGNGIKFSLKPVSFKSAGRSGREGEAFSVVTSQPMTAVSQRYSSRLSDSGFTVCFAVLAILF
jgi:hypothetical protein